MTLLPNLSEHSQCGSTGEWGKIGQEALAHLLSLGVQSLQRTERFSLWVCVLPLDNANGVPFSGLLPTHQQQNNCKLSLGYQSNKVSFLILQTSVLSPVNSSGIFNLSVLITPMFCKPKRQGTAMLNGIGQQGEESLYTKVTILNLGYTAVLHK